VKDNVVGDLSDSFSFASFFPEPLQPLMRALSKIVFHFLKLFLICKSRADQREATSNEVVDFDAERRRARALAVLDQRMQQMKQAGHTDVSLYKTDSASFSNSSDV